MNFLFKIILIILAIISLSVFIIIYQIPKKLPRCSGNCLYQNSNEPLDNRVSDLLGRMTLEEKIGQMSLVEKNSIHNLNDIHEFGLGAILSGSGAKPDSNTKEGWYEMVINFQKEALKSRLQIPVLYASDAIHGHSHVLGATIFPHFIGLGATGDQELVRRVGEITSKELSATGVYWNLSPNLDVVKDIRWGRSYESFGSDVNLVSRLGKAFLSGSNIKINGINVLSTPKHYVGTGAMKWGSSFNQNFQIDQGMTDISETQLRSEHLPAFKEAVQSGAKVIMSGLNSWNGEKIAGNSYLLNEILKAELGFEGFVVSDWYGVYELSEDKYEATVKAINSGVDMVMLPYEYQKFASDMKKAVLRNDITEDRVNDAVRRILKVKFEVGLFDNPLPLSTEEIGTVKNREVAREAVRKSLVVLRDENNLLPISRDIKKILISGSAADNLGMQSGGWTLEWQGVDGNWFPGTSILQGIKKVLNENSIEYNKEGNFKISEKADWGIAIVGEKPYSEGWGDKENPGLSEEDIAAINKTKSLSNKLLVIIISGRPLDIKSHVKNWDSVIAAWLPGSEGSGVAEVVFGLYPFTGKLPVSWELE